MALKRNRATIGLLLPLILMLAACGEQEPFADEPVSRPVKLFTVGEVPASETLEFPGSVSAAKQSDMAFEVPGLILDMPVTEGDRVTAGTILAKLDSRHYEAERDRALAERNAARVDFNRYYKAFKAQAVTEQQLDAARRALDVAEAVLRQANKAVEDTVLKAPFDGRVARKLVEDYANVQAKQPVLVLQSDGVLEMRVQIPEADWVREKPVDSVEEIEDTFEIYVVLSSLPDKAIPAKVTAFSSSADPQTRTFEVKVGFEPPEGIAISPGMTGHVAYTQYGEYVRSGLFIPAGAVFAAPDNSPSVWKFHSEAGTLNRQHIEVGELNGKRIEVLSGLEIGDRIAVSGVHTLNEGVKVHPWEN